MGTKAEGEKPRLLSVNKTNIKNKSGKPSIELSYFNSLFEDSPDAIVILNNQKLIVRTNSKFNDLFGLRDNEIIGNKLSELLNKKGKVGYRAVSKLDSLIKSEIVHDIEFIDNRKNLIIKVQTIPVKFKNKKIGVYKIFHDITEQTHSGQIIEQTRQTIRNIFEAAPDSIGVISPDGDILDFNRASLELFGYKEGDKDYPNNCFDLVTEKDKPKVHRAFQTVLKRGYLKNILLHLIKKDGSEFPAEISARLMSHNKSEIANLVVIATDITERVNYEKKLREAREKAIESDKLKSAFLANMSHEIRTPMNAIIGFSKLLTAGNISETENEQYIEIIKNTGNILLNIIDDIIDIAKIEAGQIQIHKTETAVNKILHELHAFFEKERKRHGKNHLKLILSLSEPDQNFTILTDPMRFRQVMSNLLSNALKFTEEGEIQFGYTIQDQKTLKFFVKDTGIGIPDGKTEVIFERFRQIELSESKKFGGTGLGLAITKNLLKLLGGKIWVDSEKGKGSCFYFTLPLIRIEKPDAQHTSTVQELSNQNFEGKVILLVEDNELNVKLLEKLLEPTRVKIIWARDGNPSIEICKSGQQIDLILMDIQMPEMDGYQATRIIKSIIPKVPVIAQTAYAMTGEREKILEAGFDEYLSKPIQIKELIQLLNKYLLK
jgi:PAS domain S-box-containing protein